MDRRPGVLWFLASLIAIGLFFVPVINGIVAGAFGGWFEHAPHKAGGHALIAALAVFPVLWIVSLYGVVWWPFSPFSASLRAAFCCIPLFVVAVLVCTLRNTRRSAAVRLRRLPCSRARARRVRSRRPMENVRREEAHTHGKTDFGRSGGP